MIGVVPQELANLAKLPDAFQDLSITFDNLNGAQRFLHPLQFGDYYCGRVVVRDDQVNIRDGVWQ